MSDNGSPARALPWARRALQHGAAVFVCLVAGAAAYAAPPATVQTMVVQSADAALVVRSVGQGPAILMVPSAGRSTHDFDALALKIAAAHWRVVLPEPRGVAGSTGLRDDLTLGDYGRDILAVMNRLKIKRCVLLAHAAGARDARMAISIAPERFSRLISLATGAGGETAINSGISRERANEAHEQAGDPTRFPDAERLAALQLLYFAPTSDAAAWLKGWWPESAAVHGAAARRTGRDAWWPGRPISSLIVEAQEDAIAPPQGEMALKALLGNDAVIVILPGAGHAMLPEQPSAIAAVVLAYLSGKVDGLQAVIDARVIAGSGVTAGSK